MHARALAAEASVSELQAALTAALTELQRLTVTHSTASRGCDASRPVSPPLQPHRQSLHHHQQQQQLQARPRRVPVVAGARGPHGGSQESEDEQEVLMLLQRVGSMADVSSSSGGVRRGRLDQDPKRKGAGSADPLLMALCWRGGGGQSSRPTKSSEREADRQAAKAVCAGREESGPPALAAAEAVEATSLDLQQHRRRWRAKQELLQRKATEWQYTAWRYATAWQEVAAKLQDTDLQLQVSLAQQAGPTSGSNTSAPQASLLHPHTPSSLPQPPHRTTLSSNAPQPGFSNLTTHAHLNTSSQPTPSPVPQRPLATPNTLSNAAPGRSAAPAAAQQPSCSLTHAYTGNNDNDNSIAMDADLRRFVEAGRFRQMAADAGRKPSHTASTASSRGRNAEGSSPGMPHGYVMAGQQRRWRSPGVPRDRARSVSAPVRGRPCGVGVAGLSTSQEAAQFHEAVRHEKSLRGQWHYPNSRLDTLVLDD
ncbi:MAG: hypothetical protein WDW36_009792 [Sanguina aurantia]